MRCSHDGKLLYCDMSAGHPYIRAHSCPRPASSTVFVSDLSIQYDTIQYSNSLHACEAARQRRRLERRLFKRPRRTDDILNDALKMSCLKSRRATPTKRSSSSDLLIVPHRVWTVTASRAFRVAAPTMWNNLPDFVKLVQYF